jgi:hypothetical protein
MDCEKFESAMMDELYGELDELTSAAAKRHVASCSRCAARLGGLRATRRLATVPLVDAPADLEDRILAAARDAMKVTPLRRRVAQAVSLAGSWAMRPQTAMAAVFLVMIGTSVLLLRGKAREVARAPVTVTEQGSPAPPVVAAAQPPEESATTSALVTGGAAAPPPAARLAESRPMSAPAPLASALGPDSVPGDSRDTRSFAKAPPSRPRADQESLGQVAYAQPPAAAAPMPAPKMAPPPAPAAGGAGLAQGAYAQGLASSRGGATSPFDSALAQYRSGQFDPAARAFDALAPNDVNAELWAARSVREGTGCGAAVARFDHVAQRAPGAPAGRDALLEGALCFRALSSFGEARARLGSLLRVPSYRDRARAELDRIDQMQQNSQAQQNPSASTPPAKAASKPGSASPPAATSTGSSNTGY